MGRPEAVEVTGAGLEKCMPLRSEHKLNLRPPNGQNESSGSSHCEWRASLRDLQTAQGGGNIGEVMRIIQRGDKVLGSEEK